MFDMRRAINEKGFTLIEVMVALGVGSVVMLGIVSTMELLNRSNMRQGIIQSRSEIITKIRTQALNFDNLKVSATITKGLGQGGLLPDIGTANSIDHYDMLAKCMPEFNDSNAVGCDKNVMDLPNKGNQFYLADSLSTDPTKTVAGEDVFYRANGIRCTQSEAAEPNNCPLQARVWFEPYCLNFAKTCNKAMSLAVRYSVGVREGVDSSHGVGVLEGEVYIPVQKGIQLSRLLNDNDVPIASNSYGIFSVQKFYDTQLAKGLRFEAVISNPTGLVSMKLQKRALVGEAAKNYGEDVVPRALEQTAWEDIPTPNNPSQGPWSINLTNARPNQFFNFGTQATPAINSRTPTSFLIGSNDANNATYRWTKNPATGEYKPPIFRSGLYQFRIVASDAAGNWMESTNYFTVRIIGRPEILFVNDGAELVKNRDCVSSIFNYRILVGDDEYISDSKVELNNVNLNFPQVHNNHGSFTVPFDLSQAAGNYTLKVTLKNPLSDINLENFAVPKRVETRNIDLRDVLPAFDSLGNVPSKIRINTDGTVTATYRTGNCCNQQPSVNWSYPAPAAFGSESLLSGSTSTTMTCSTSGNTKTCTANVTVTGLKEGPLTSNPPADIMATLNFQGQPSDACKMSSTAGYTVSKYVPVVKNPTISFYLTESLWLDIPGDSIQSKTPRVIVRSDFAPEQTVKIQVVKASDSSEVCTVEFLGNSSPGNPIDKSCNLPNGFSGDLLLQKAPGFESKVQADSDSANPSYKARLTGSLIHRTCSANLTNLPNQTSRLTVNADIPMNDSPWGTTTVGGNTVQDSLNDSGKWTAGTEKRLRCYDSWSSYSDSYNKQDYYDLYKYNNETRLANPWNIPAAKHNGVGSITNPLQFATFVFPNNPPVIVDFSAKNVPYLYSVYQDNGNPSNTIWQYTEEGGSGGQTQEEGWENVTEQVCAGVGSLAKTKLFRIKMSANSNSGNIILKAINRAYSSAANGSIHSYIFLCEYGRWHPSGKDYVNWTN